MEQIAIVNGSLFNICHLVNKRNGYVGIILHIQNPIDRATRIINVGCSGLPLM